MPNIDSIEQKFLEPGHTQMECDSMHAAIEHAKKSTSIFIPSMWDTVIHMARRKNPYIVVPLKHDNFWNLKKLSKDFCHNVKVTTNSKRINWFRIKCLHFKKENKSSFLVKESYDQAEYDTVCIRKNAKRGKPRQLPILERLYTGKLAIAQAKKDDLLSLCNSGIIPAEFRNFYEKLPSNGKLADKLPVPDVTEEDMDTDED